MSELFPVAARKLELRGYQLDTVEQARELIRQGKKNILICAPTGSGKTATAAHLIDESIKKGKHSAFVVDLNVLAAQTSAVFDSYGIDHGVMQADHSRRQPWQKVQVCSAQTIQARKWPDADLIVIDECHVIRKVVADRIRPRDTVTIGLTATPFTRGLGKIYDALINVTTTHKLIADGFLAPYKIFECVEPDMAGVKVVAGEWVDGEASKRALQVVGDVVGEYVKIGEGRKFICSACDVAHCEELARQFNAAGIRAETYTYKTTDEKRAETIQEFHKDDSKIRGLVTVTAASRGFDCPSVSCVIMARPLRKSLAEHIQFFGRGLRIHPGKTDCLVIDHSGNSRRFMDDWHSFFETGCLELDDGKPKPKPKKKPEDEAPAFIKCSQCKHMHTPAPKCPVCGHEHPRKQTVQHAPGTLQELIAGGDRRRLTAEVWPQVCGYVRQTRQGDAARKMALAIYRQMTGAWPKMDFEDTKSAPVSAAVHGQIMRGRIAYSKSVKAGRRVIERAQEVVEEDGRW